MTTPLTIGLAIAFFGFAAGGIAIVLWLQKILAGQKDELLDAIADARSAVDAKVDELEARIDGFNSRLHAHELSVRDRFEHFLSKQTFRDVSSEIKQTIASGLDRMEARMIRLEGYIQPSGTLSNALRRIEQAQTRDSP